jgi:hypothetical protein
VVSAVGQSNDSIGKQNPSVGSLGLPSSSEPTNVVDMILSSQKGIVDEEALSDFVKAALEVPSWTDEDTRILKQVIMRHEPI